MPVEFLCPISRSLMADPVIVPTDPTGQTFERSCIQACADLAFTPPNLAIDLSATPLLLIPNLALKKAIVSWCNRTGLRPPLPIPPDAARALVLSLMSPALALGAKDAIFKPKAAELGGDRIDEKDDDFRPEANVASFGAPDSETDSVDKEKDGFRQGNNYGALDFESDRIDEKDVNYEAQDFGSYRINDKDDDFRPKGTKFRTLTSNSHHSNDQVNDLDTPTSNSNQINNKQDDNSRSKAPLPFSVRTKKPNPFLSQSSIPYSSSPQTSINTPPPPPPPNISNLDEDQLLANLKHSNISDQEFATSTLRQATRDSQNLRLKLCTPRLLSSLHPLLLSNNPILETNTSAALVNLSLEPPNKLTILRSGLIPPLITALNSTNQDLKANAAAVLFSLALSEANRTPIGVLGAIPPLIKLFSSSPVLSCRRDAGMALYHLSLTSTNRSKLSGTQGAIKALLTIAGEREDVGDATLHGPCMARISMMILCNLAGSSDGRSALMDTGAVSVVVEILRCGGPAGEEHCVSALYGMSKGSLRFRGLARAAGAERELVRVAEGGGVRKEMARKILRAMRGEEDYDDGGPLPMRFRDGSGVSSGTVKSLPNRYRERYDVDVGSDSAAF